MCLWVACDSVCVPFEVCVSGWMCVCVWACRKNTPKHHVAAEGNEKNCWLCWLQDFEDWDDVGLNMPKPPGVIHLFRDYGTHVSPTNETQDCECQADLGDKEQARLVEELQDARQNLVCAGLFFLVFFFWSVNLSLLISFSGVNNNNSNTLLCFKFWVFFKPFSVNWDWRMLGITNT